MLQQRTRRGEETRERLLELAEAAVLQKGFGATSIEELIAGAGITKSGFFYHFRDKNDLAKALILRYLENDKAILDEIFRRGDELNEDPLHGFLIGLKLFAEMMADLPGAHPGCLAASYAYQEQLFSEEVRQLSRQGALLWRERFRERLAIIAAKYPPRIDVDLDAMADMVLTLVDGGITISKLLRDQEVLPSQVLAYRDFIRLIFTPER
jgi:TetR/AcrR family transcriptional regulator, transcriptional repressor for nem operon